MSQGEYSCDQTGSFWKDERVVRRLVISLHQQCLFHWGYLDPQILFLIAICHHQWCVGHFPFNHSPSLPQILNLALKGMNHKASEDSTL